MNVTIELADLVEIYKSADLYDFMKGKSEEAEKKVAELKTALLTAETERDEARTRKPKASAQLRQEYDRAWNAYNMGPIFVRKAGDYATYPDVSGEAFLNVSEGLHALLSAIEAEGLL